MDLNTLLRCLSLGWGTKLEEDSGLGKYGFGLKGASLATCKKCQSILSKNLMKYLKFILI